MLSRRGGTDEFLRRGTFGPAVTGLATAWGQTLYRCLVQPRADAVKRTSPVQTSAKEVNRMRKLHEKEEKKSSEFRGAPIDF